VTARGAGVEVIIGCLLITAVLAFKGALGGPDRPGRESAVVAGVLALCMTVAFAFFAQILVGADTMYAGYSVLGDIVLPALFLLSWASNSILLRKGLI
jgi:hypothetical protein